LISVTFWGEGVGAEAGGGDGEEKRREEGGLLPALVV